MRLHRFYLSEKIEGDKINIKDERLIHQWRNVFRYNVGSEVILFDGNGFDFSAVIVSITNREAELEIAGKKNAILPGVNTKNNITLYQSLIKKDNFEFITEKVTELGVSKIIPIISERSEKKGINMERLNKIAVEASEQCGRGNIPEILDIQNLEDVLENIEGEIIIFDKSGEKLAASEFSSEISVFIGPEGGWTEKELDLFKQKGAHMISLGPLTLRAETAAIAGLSRFL